jgi:predicted RNA-binding Zn-ribbon protein involved in translation (DUF1610 family)
MEAKNMKRLECLNCGYKWQVPKSTPVFCCPQCGSLYIKFADEVRYEFESVQMKMTDEDER